VVVIDHLDLDLRSAEALLEARPGAVVNVRRSVSGRQPVRGAALLVDAGVPVVDDVGPGLLSQVADGSPLRVDMGRVYAGPELVGEGTALTPGVVEASQEAARASIDARLAAVGADSAEFLRRHEDLLLEGRGLPDVRLRLADRYVLVVAPGGRSAADLAALRGWLRERRPAVLAADSGTGLALAAGLRPDLVVGDPGEARERRIGDAERLGPDSIPDGLTATDLAVVLATAAGARLVVLTGSPVSYDELLDRDRPTSAALLAVRLTAGDRLVDAAAVARLHRPAVSWGWVVVLLVAGLLAVLVALLAVPWGADLLHRVKEALPW
jgi:uncharacterized membrane-anchored protein